MGEVVYRRFSRGAGRLRHRVAGAPACPDRHRHQHHPENLHLEPDRRQLALDWRRSGPVPATAGRLAWGYRLYEVPSERGEAVALGSAAPDADAGGYWWKVLIPIVRYSSPETRTWPSRSSMAAEVPAPTSASHRPAPSAPTAARTSSTVDDTVFQCAVLRSTARVLSGNTGPMGGERRQVRVWSWAATEDDVKERREHAEQLISQCIQAVRYYTIDYERDERHAHLVGAGPRLVKDKAEWAEPEWRHSGFDAVDYGIELVTETEQRFSLTWDPPGEHEGIGLRNVPMLGTGVRRDADVAVWDLTTHDGKWAVLLGNAVTKVDLHYTPDKSSDRDGRRCGRSTRAVSEQRGNP
jgi:hypothetical protein